MTMMPAAASVAELLLRVESRVEDLDRQGCVSRRLRNGSGSTVTKVAAPTSSSGAASPSARETARITPVAMPGIAAGSTWRRIVCHCVAPSASEPSRIEGGTARIASRAAMITIGSTSSARVIAPAA